MQKPRQLPDRRNPLLQDEHTPPVEVLIERRQLGTTVLEAKPGFAGLTNATESQNLGNFDCKRPPNSHEIHEPRDMEQFYNGHDAHLKVPLPKDLKGAELFPPGAMPVQREYFLMRRSRDGYVSTSGMFKACFPWATRREEQHERDHLSASPETDRDEIAGNLWSSEEFALSLATEYGILDWITALVDPHPIHDADPSIASPPEFRSSKNESKTEPSVNGSMSTRRTASRDLRSMSPVKQSAPKSDRPKATPRKRRTKKSAATPSVADSVASEPDELEEVNGIFDDEKGAVPKVIEEVAEDAAEVADEAAAIIAADEAAEDSEPLKDGTVRVSVVEDVVAGEDDTETTRTTVRVELPSESKELELPKDTEGVVEMAREIVESAKQLQEGTTNGDAAAKSKKNMKRKAEVLDEDDELAGPEEIIQEVAEGNATELASGEVELHGRPNKRTRVMVPAEEYRREKVRRRALMGLSGALAIGVMIPFLQNLL